MKLSMDSSTLGESIAAAASSLPSRPATPIIGGVLVEARIGAVSLSSFNYERATTRTVAADVADAGIAVVSGRLLSTIGANLPKSADVDVIVDDSEMLIRCGRTIFRLPLMVVEDYPQLPTLEPDDAIGTVDCDTFIDAVRVIGGFASTDDTLPPITALNIACEAKHLVLRATDRYIAARRRIPWDSASDNNPTINIKAADLVATIKAADYGSVGQPIQLFCNANVFGVKTASTTVITRLFAEDFPSVDRVMNVEQHCTAATTPTAVLVSIAKRAAAIAEDGDSVVEIAIEAEVRAGGHQRPTLGSLTLATAGKDAVGKFTDSIDVARHGTNRKLKLSSGRLYRALSAIDAEDATIAFQSQPSHLVHLYPGRLEPDELGNLTPPDTDTVAMLMGVRSAT